MYTLEQQSLKRNLRLITLCCFSDYTLQQFEMLTSMHFVLSFGAKLLHCFCIHSLLCKLLQQLFLFVLNAC